MSWQIAWTARARRDLQRLVARARERTIIAVGRLGETEHDDIKPLRGSRNEWRLRVGDWRVRYLFDPATRSIEILRVLPRGRAYRD